MLHQKTVSHKQYNAQKEQRIAYAERMLSIDMDERGTFAIVPSTSSTGTYRVDIDEESQRVPQATACECKGNKEFGHTCIHMQATQRLFNRVCARPVATPDQFVKGFEPETDLVTACTVSEAVTDADTQVRINEQQAKRDAVSNPYDVLAPTKQVSREAYVAMFNPCGL
jgi:hypothetical protein